MYAVKGTYVDCFTTEIAAHLSFQKYVFTFYTTPLFRLERWILTGMLSKPSSDGDAQELVDGQIERFAAWRVEGRKENELLMCDFSKRTRSWFMLAPPITVADHRTRLYFGSAVVPVRDLKTGKTSLGFGYQALLGFHKVYSVLLLYSAASRLSRRISKIGT